MEPPLRPLSGSATGGGPTPPLFRPLPLTLPSLSVCRPRLSTARAHQLAGQVKPPLVGRGSKLTRGRGHAALTVGLSDWEYSLYCCM